MFLKSAFFVKFGCVLDHRASIFLASRSTRRSETNRYTPGPETSRYMLKSCLIFDPPDAPYRMVIENQKHGYSLSVT